MTQQHATRYERRYERRYGSTWVEKNGPSPLAKLGSWMAERRDRKIADAPLYLLLDAAENVAERLPLIAAREPTRRHRRHFAWLLTWSSRIAEAIEVRLDEAHAYHERGMTAVLDRSEIDG